ncbi:uncharacterized protein LOC129748853 [Uranotaenia lowii]|uniref:uncharacterized protein LOC129743947 n=1 Tax=Uranotaenia lowii TaxID=190385 RepID=UPI0024787ACC|nr:uncharacterized protein LOC129743947 [Uranotaenia lowii]XP_055599593.1 uncharacterized protein LOC129748853 [Uranotaenia lowii]
MVKPVEVGLFEDDIREVVSRYYRLQGDVHQGTVLDYWIEHFGGSPSGFLADHYDLRIKVNNDENTTDELSFFLKVIPTKNDVLANYLNEMGSFRKEVTLFQNILPKIYELVPTKQVMPRCLLTKDENLLVMENVKLKGFDILKDNHGFMDYAFLTKALESLAHIHAGSIILEERDKVSLVEKFPNALRENGWTGVGTRKRDVENVIVLWCEFMRIVERDSSKLKKILAELPGTIRRMYDYVKPSQKWRNVLNHGDLWSNNVMFKTSASGDPQDCILVDFQLSRYTPAAYDVNLLLALTTTGEFRSQHMVSLLDNYFSTFQSILTDNKIDPNVVYTKDEFLESCEYYRLAGQIHGCVIAPEVLLPQCYLDQVFDSGAECAGFMPQSKVQICLQAFRNDHFYRDRVMEMIQELITQ